MSDKPMKDNRLKKKIDKEDANYVAKIAEKVIQEHDGRIPVNQLDEEYLKGFPSTNWQMRGSEPPLDEQDTLAIYLVDATNGASRRFTVTYALVDLLTRKTDKIGYGTSDLSGKQQFRVVIQWEKEKRI